MGRHMKTYSEWYNQFITEKGHVPSAIETWEECEGIHQHKMRNRIQAKDMKIAVLERQLREYAKTPHEDVPTHQRESDLGVSS
jgi:hypothetical protein